jgi:Mg2+-importing ATPase
MIALSVTLGFTNEYRATRFVDELQQKVTLKAVVTRDNKRKEISSRMVVPGDIVSIYIGDVVPADMRLIDSKNLQCDESTLTGESFPVEKTCDSLNLQRPTPQQLVNHLFMGTVVTHGGGRGVVVATGRNTEFGAISRSLIRPHPETEFQRGIKSYGKMLMTLTLALALGIFAIGVFVGKPVFDSLMFTLAVAVGLVPELMPAIVTISLSEGARRMAKVRVIAKRLVSIEDFGNMDVLCSDKTGTLTIGKTTLRDIWSLGEKDDPKILTYALLCNSAVVGEQVTGNAMDVAIWEYAISNNKQEDYSNFRSVSEIPFDYARRMMSTVVTRDGETILITKGAPESVLPKCIDAEKNGKKEPIGLFLKEIKDKLSDISGVGYRTIAVAYRAVGEPETCYSTEDEVDLTFLGFVVFIDPPKKDAREAVARLKSMGVDVKILTGDNELVAKKICEELQIPIKKIVLGADLIELSSTEIKKVVEETTIFARITPEQKLDIIKALKANKHVVGFMGDGVNDAPALYEADVGISVDSAADVSKDAADIVLLEKDLFVLANGISEGRKIFGNTSKYVLMGTSSNFGNMFSTAAAFVFLPFMPMLPMQIIFMNLLYDMSNMTLPTDNVDVEETKQPKQWDIGFIRKFTVFIGPFSSLYDFLTYGIMLFIFGASATLFQTGWFVESFWTEVLIIFVIRTRRVPFVRSRPGKWLALLTLSFVAFGTILPFTILGGLLGFTQQLPAAYWVLMLLMVATYLFLVDAAKVFFFKVCKF